MEERLAGERKGNLWEGAGQIIPPTPYGCFSRDYAEDVVHIHFTNVLQPRSPFRDMQALARSLLKLLDDLGARPAGHPDCAVRQLDQLV